MAGHPMRVALVSGGNRGLGFAACRGLAARGFVVILGSRDLRRGEEATACLGAEGLTVTCQQLDVTDDHSVWRLLDATAERFGRLDVLVNNAGIALDGPTGQVDPGLPGSVLDLEIEVLRRTLDTNAFGAYRLCQAFVPLMRKGGYGRIVNISSGKGQLSRMVKGWPTYRMSKALLNAYTAILADELRGSNILVNAACPGWARTDMGGPNAERTPEQAVDTVLWLATLPDDGPTGGFFRDRQRLDW